MFRTIALVAALALAAASASAQTIDDKGKCHDASGKMAPMSACRPAAATPLGKAAHCKDTKGKFTKCPAATKGSVKSST